MIPECVRCFKPIKDKIFIRISVVKRTSTRLKSISNVYLNMNCWRKIGFKHKTIWGLGKHKAGDDGVGG